MKLLLALLAAYLLYAGVFFLAQRRLMYPGTYLARVSPDAEPPPSAERVWLEVPPGRVEAWFFAPASVGPTPPAAAPAPATAGRRPLRQLPLRLRPRLPPLRLRRRLPPPRLRRCLPPLRPTPPPP
jgi:hypothetical protein